MTRVTWLGEDVGGTAGPSFTTAFDIKFPKGEAVEVTDPDMLKRIKKNRFFSVAGPGRPPVKAAHGYQQGLNQGSAAQNYVNQLTEKPDVEDPS